ncbi:MAG: hypothetical protein QOH10_2032 [Actinomycetota bacterium]|jgi:hypothetical protein|nr:hypothetical protein [Actinomycetota bacterium]
MADQTTASPMPTPFSTPADDTADTLVALARLREDPDPAVRIEVADILEELARTRPTVVLATAQRWLAEGGVHTRAVVRRALQVLSRSGDDGARRLLGFAPEVAVRVRDVALESDHVRAGESLRIRARAVSAETRRVAVSIDAVVDDQRPIIVSTRRLDPLETVDLRLVLPLRSDAARPGPHTASIRVNGRLEAVVDFTVVM